jgi:hypothetical protein
MKILKDSRKNIPVLALLIANAIPLFGVLFLGWDAFSIVLLYWAENLVIGFYNVLKIALVKVEHPSQHLGKLFFIPFFILHFGGFTAGHGFFVLALFKKEGGEVLSGMSWPGFLVFLELLIKVISQVYSLIPLDLKYAFLALFFSHGVSFVTNYLMKKEYTKEKVNSLMGRPYARIFVLHVAIIFGGFLTMALNLPAAILFVLVILKTVLDVTLHLREHKKIQSGKAST